MTGLPWMRIDADLATNPKLAALIADQHQRGLAAVAVYVMSIGHAVRNGTDGRLARHDLHHFHGNPALAQLLVDYELWHKTAAGWTIHDYADYQQLTTITRSRSLTFRRINCRRWHGGPDQCFRPECADLWTDQ